MRGLSAIILALLPATGATAKNSWNVMSDDGVFDGYRKEFQEKPPDPPSYMVDNQDNLSGKAPNKGEYNGAVWAASGSFENYMKKLRNGDITGSPEDPSNIIVDSNVTDSHLAARQSGSYWLPSLAPSGKQPMAGATDYKFYRDVTKYGADPTGKKDASEAINAAIMDGDRCGMECGNTFSKGAIIYFPSGTYKICTPIIQLYYSQFIGDPLNRPIIKGCDKFTGIALVDTDPYIPNEATPDGQGVNWYINQNQFFRQIRNFVFDMTEMPLKTDDHNQPLVPTGLHWQVSQACSLQNLLFKMPTTSGGKKPTHVGIFTENGSGGFVSDLVFEGGAIGWRVGSQQYTARGLKFTNCITAIQMIWDWGFNFQDIEVNGGSIGLNISGKGGLTGQGIGSISLIDSAIKNVPIGILTRESSTDAPNIVIDNTDFSGVNAPVQTDNGKTLLSGSQKVTLWATGRRYTGGKGSPGTGAVTGQPKRPQVLLGSNGKLFTRSRPQYENLGADKFLVATQNNCKNDGTGDQTSAINAFLKKAAAAGQVAYFPAGIYLVKGTVEIPVNSKVLGASWSQIQATGSYFSDMKKPQVVVQAGKPGDKGFLEMTDMIISTKGPTAGAIMVEWNVKASSNGAAGMWDSHIRVGGALGSDLDHEKCPKLGYSEACITASLLLHVTSGSTGYFENVWAWVADHDNDMSLYWEFDKLASQISLYSGRGILVESQGPCWFYGTGSEHTILYQYQLRYAKNIYLGHIQTESPYFQPVPVAPKPFGDSIRTGRFRGDPTFADCTSNACKEAWGLRILNSEDIVVHSAGLYSWFVNYEQACLNSEDCQERIMEVKGSKRVVIHNIFTKGVTQVASGSSNSTTIRQRDNKQGYTSEISLWIPLDGSENIVYVGTEVFTSKTAQCTAPCTFVFPPSQLPSRTSISLKPYTTSLEVGSSKGGSFVVTTTSIVISLRPIITDEISQSNVEITEGQTGNIVRAPSVTIPESTITVTNGDGKKVGRIITFPPWPAITNGPPDKWSSSSTGRTSSTSSGPGNVPVSTWTNPPYTKPPFVAHCPPTTHYIAQYGAVMTLKDCTGPTTMNWGCSPTKTVGINGDTKTSFSLGCTLFTGTGSPLPTYTTWPVGTLIPEPEDKSGDNDKHSGCKLWFFTICISWGDKKIGGWRWDYPPGILPPGPPPNIKWPSGVTITGTLPGPWPRVTIGNDGKVTYPEGKPTDCTAKTASICATTTNIIITTTTSQKTTTLTSTSPTCTTVTGCNVQDDDDSVTTTISCSGGTTSTRGAVQAAIAARATDAAVVRRAGCPKVTLESFTFYPKNPRDVKVFVNYLKTTLGHDDKPLWEKTKHVEGGGFTAFFFLANVDQKKAYAIHGQLDALGLMFGHSIIEMNDSYEGRLQPGGGFSTSSEPWELSLMSIPPKGKWEDYFSPEGNPNELGKKADSSFGRGQTIYLVEDGIFENHPEFSGKTARFLSTTEFPAENEGPPLNVHGTQVGSRLWGKTLGLARNAEMVVVTNSNGDPPDKRKYIQDRYLSSLVAVLKDVTSKSEEERRKVIINMSFGWEAFHEEFVGQAHFKILYELLKSLDSLGVVMVAATHNSNRNLLYRNKINGWPSKFGGPDAAESEKLGNLIVVSGIDRNSVVSPLNPFADWLAMAPGYRVHVAQPGASGLVVDDGASLAVPLIVSTIAYWRGLKLPAAWAEELKDPANVKKLVMYMHRKLDYGRVPIEGPKDENHNDFPVRFIWTGRVKDGDCLVDPKLAGCPPNLAGSRIADLKPFGADCSSSSRTRRQSGGSCPLVITPKAPGTIAGETVTYKQGSPSPTCKGGCGDVCSGYYCQAKPTGTPPDYWDPEDPAHPPQTEDFPPLQPPTACTGSEVSTPTVICNGSGNRPACVTTTACVVPPSTTTSSSTKQPEPTPETPCIYLRVFAQQWQPSGDVYWDLQFHYSDGTDVCHTRPVCNKCLEQQARCNDGFSMIATIKDNFDSVAATISYPGVSKSIVKLDLVDFSDECLPPTNAPCPIYIFEKRLGVCK